MSSGPEYNPGYESRPPDGLVLPPWEERHRFGFLNALYQTVKQTLLSPSDFFSRMPTQLGPAQPLLFAIVIGTISALFNWMWSLTGASLELFFESDLSDIMRAPLLAGLGFVLSPVLATIAVFLSAGVSHLILTAVGGNRLGFEATFRDMAYAEAGSVLLIVPICGNVLSLVWTALVSIIGLAKIHDTDQWRAVVAVVVPIIVCLSMCGGVFLFGLGAGLMDR